jgi:hypothetical protein
VSAWLLAAAARQTVKQKDVRPKAGIQPGYQMESIEYSPRRKLTGSSTNHRHKNG